MNFGIPTPTLPSTINPLAPKPWYVSVLRYWFVPVFVGASFIIDVVRKRPYTSGVRKLLK